MDCGIPIHYDFRGDIDPTSPAPNGEENPNPWLATRIPMSL
jgi:hypothetical protein